MKTKVKGASGLSHMRTDSEMGNTGYILISIPQAPLVLSTSPRGGHLFHMKMKTFAGHLQNPGDRKKETQVPPAKSAGPSWRQRKPCSTVNVHLPSPPTSTDPQTATCNPGYREQPQRPGLSVCPLLDVHNWSCQQSTQPHSWLGLWGSFG